MSAMSWAERDARVTWHPFTQMQAWRDSPPLVIDRAEGAWLIDVDGKRYLDGVASLWCNVHGHRHPRLDAALRAQLDRVAHSTFLGLSHPPAIELAERLVEVAPRGLERVFYSDSGSAAVEIALKLAFQYQQLTGAPKRRRFLHLTDGYHGDTLGAVGVGGIEVFHRIFGPIVVAGHAIRPPYRGPGVDEVAALADALDALDRALAERGDEFAAVVVEPLIQGAAGMRTHVPGYLAELVQRCRSRGLLVIVDEVATGFGRTGRMFACEHEDVRPDLLCVAKGLSGGYLPLAATLSTARVYEAFLGDTVEGRHFFHGHTFTANPLACAVAIASLELLRDETLARVETLASALGRAADRLRAMPEVLEVRQVGAMVGIELRPGETPLRGARTCRAARELGVVLRPLGDVIVWMPPLSLTLDELEIIEETTRSAIGITK